MIQASAQLQEELASGLTTLYVTAEVTAEQKKADSPYDEPVTFNCVKGDFIQEGNSYVAAVDSSGVALGTAVQKSMTLVLINDAQKFDGVKFVNSIFIVYANADLTTGQTEQIKLGKFTVIDGQVDNYKITLSLVDDMLLTDIPFETDLSFPVTAGTLLADICNSCGLVLGDSQFPNYNLSLPVKPKDGSFRDIIANIASIAGGITVLDADNYLRVKTYKNYQDIEADVSDMVSGTRMSGDLFVGNEDQTRYSELADDQVFSYTGVREITQVNQYYRASFVIDYSLANSGNFYGTFVLTVDSSTSVSCIVEVWSVNDGTLCGPVYNEYGEQVIDRIVLDANYTNARILIYVNNNYVEEYNSHDLTIDMNLVFSRPDNTSDWADYAGIFNPWETSNSIDDGQFNDLVDYHNLYAPLSMKVAQSTVTGIIGTIEYTTTTYGGAGKHTMDSSDSYWVGRDIKVDMSKCPFINTKIEGTSSEEYQAVRALQTFLNTIGNKINHKVRFTPFNCQLTTYPFAELLDVCYFDSASETLLYSYISNIQLTFSGRTTLSNSAQLVNTLQPVSSNASAIRSIAESIRTVSRQIEPYESQVQQLNDLANNASPYYITQEVDGNSLITYYHNNTTLISSTVVYKICREGLFLSHDGGQTWISGFDKDGNLVCYTASIGDLATAQLHITDGHISNELYLKNHSSPVGTMLFEELAVGRELQKTVSAGDVVTDPILLTPGTWLLTVSLPNCTADPGPACHAIIGNRDGSTSSTTVFSKEFMLTSGSYTTIITISEELYCFTEYIGNGTGTYSGGAAFYLNEFDNGLQAVRLI